MSLTDIRFETTATPQTFARLFIETVRRHRLEERVIVQSMETVALRIIAVHAPTIRRSACYAGVARDLVSYARDAAANILSPVHLLTNRNVVTKAHRAQLQVVSWTANTEAVWRKLIDADVDGEWIDGDC